MDRGGFRMSAADAAVLIVGTAATLIGRRHLGDLWPLPLLLLLHFFLFCNVFRVRRRWELMWAAVFVLNVLAWQVAVGRIFWAGVLLAQTPVTLAVISAQVSSGWYHGIGFARLPARFSEKWRGRHEQRESQAQEQVPQPRAPA